MEQNFSKGGNCRMKKNTKVCLWITLGMTVLGLFLIVIGIAVGGAETFSKGLQRIGSINCDFGDFFGSHNGREQHNGESSDYSISQDRVQDIEITIKMYALKIIPYSGDEIQVHFEHTNRNQDFSCKVENGTLLIEETTLNHTMNFNEHGTASIYIPEGKQFDDVEITVNVGAVNIKDTLFCNTMSINVDAGQLIAENIKVTELELENGTGEAEISGSISGDLDADCGVGTVTLDIKGNEKDHNYSVECGIGSVSIDSNKYTALSNETEIDNGADSDYVISCGVGEVKLNFHE